MLIRPYAEERGGVVLLLSYPDHRCCCECGDVVGCHDSDGRLAMNLFILTVRLRMRMSSGVKFLLEFVLTILQKVCSVGVLR